MVDCLPLIRTASPESRAVSAGVVAGVDFRGEWINRCRWGNGLPHWWAQLSNFPQCRSGHDGAFGGTAAAAASGRIEANDSKEASPPETGFVFGRLWRHWSHSGTNTSSKKEQCEFYDSESNFDQFCPLQNLKRQIHTVHSPQSTVHSPQSIVHSPQSTVHRPRSTVHGPEFFQVHKQSVRYGWKLKRRTGCSMVHVSVMTFQLILFCYVDC